MPKLDPRVDALIAAAPEFARPILEHLRAVVHAACPEVVETIKWQYASFEYRGMMCSMAVFKAHCSFGFWKGELVTGRKPDGGMGDFGKLTSVKDLPTKKELTALIKKAMKLNEEGVKVPKSKAAARPVVVPDDLARALEKNEAASAVFTGFSPSCKREYVEWITEAKTEATRLRRLEQAVQQMAEGKKRNWKYENC